MEITNSNEPFRFTPEQVRLLDAHQGNPVQVPVQETSKVYLVIEQGLLPTLDEEYIRDGLDHAAEQASRGDEADWDVDEIKSAGRDFLARRKQPS